MVQLGKIGKVRTSLRASVMYLEKESRTEASIMTAGLNISDDPSVFMTTVRGLNAYHNVPETRIEGRTTEFSFSAEEVDSQDEEACAQAFGIIYRTAERAWGDRGFPVLLHGQRDGDAALFHVHAVLPNVNVDTGKAMRGDDHSWERVAVILAEEMEAAGMRHSHQSMRDRVQAIQEKQPHRYERSAVQRVDVQARKAGQPAFPDRVAAVLKELEEAGTKPASVEELDTALEPHGLTVRRRGKRLTYSERKAAEGKKQPQSARQDRVQLAAETLYPAQEVHHRAVLNLPERTEMRRQAPVVTLEEWETEWAEEGASRRRREAWEAEQARQEAQQQARRDLERQREAQEAERQREARRRMWRAELGRPAAAAPETTKNTGPELG